MLVFSIRSIKRDTQVLNDAVKISRATCILIVVPSLKRTTPLQRIQIITSIEMLDKMLGETFDRLKRP